MQTHAVARLLFATIGCSNVVATAHGAAQTAGDPPTATAGSTEECQPGTMGPDAIASIGSGRANGLSSDREPVATDVTDWTTWWEFNRDPILRVCAPPWEFGITGPRVVKRPTAKQIWAEVVPALRASLLESSDPSIVSSCLIALAQIGEKFGAGSDDPIDSILAGLLTSEDPNIRADTALALGILGVDRSLGLLAGLARGDEIARQAVGARAIDLKTRVFATFALGLLGNRTGAPAIRTRIVSCLTEFLTRPEPSEPQDLAVACVISLGLTPLEPAPAGTEREGSDPAAWRQNQIQFLLGFMHDESRSSVARGHAATAAGRLLMWLDDDAFREQAVDRILLPLATRKAAGYPAEVRRGCVLALGMIGDADDDPVDVRIRAALRDDVPNLMSQSRRFGSIAIAQVAANPGRRSPNVEKNRRELAELLVGRLRLSSGEQDWAALALGLFGLLTENQGGGPDPALALALREFAAAARSPMTTGASALSIGLFGDFVSRDWAIAALERSSDPSTRGHVALGLGPLGDKHAIEPVRAALKEGKLPVPEAAIALGLLDFTDTVTELVEFIAGEAPPASKSAAAAALRLLGGRAAVAPLVALLRDETADAARRSAAAEALGRIIDKEGLPWRSKFTFGLDYHSRTPTLDALLGSDSIDGH
ncbi:HEAT repeat domain-containing protein [Engelhardtia mirabilis]|uniref:HEAT repeat protein n=1 Tax=Engelhardtia mirabilis TaxID=2528011 RepID=A0A518BKQ4_9BACT|nr:HEAT repeat protein [Planctomycetes bacterium Pla133]QDV01877.1 HEAT repeat protein [Planctomycetes bacterium Pla86]